MEERREERAVGCGNRKPFTQRAKWQIAYERTGPNLGGGSDKEKRGQNGSRWGNDRGEKIRGTDVGAKNTDIDGERNGEERGLEKRREKIKLQIGRNGDASWKYWAKLQESKRKMRMADQGKSTKRWKCEKRRLRERSRVAWTETVWISYASIADESAWFWHSLSSALYRSLLRRVSI